MMKIDQKTIEGKERVNLGGRSLGDEGAKEVVSFLENNRAVKVLNLANNQIGSKGGAAIVAALQTNLTLVEIIVYGNEIGKEVETDIKLALLRNRQLSEQGEALSRWDAKGEVEKVIECLEKVKRNSTLFKTTLSLSQFFNCSNATRILEEQSGEGTSVKVPLKEKPEKELSSLNDAALRGDLERVEELMAKEAGCEMVQEEPIIKGIERRLTTLDKEENPEEIERLEEIRTFLQETLNTLLIQAGELENGELAKKALKAGARLNVLGSSQTFLEEETNAFQKELIALLEKTKTESETPKLLEDFANALDRIPSLKEINLAPYLPSLVAGGKLQLLKCLINSGANVNTCYGNGNTLLHIAFALDQIEVGRLLIASGARIDVKNKDGSSPFQMSQKEDHSAFAKELLTLQEKVAKDLKSYSSRLDTHQALIGELQQIVDVKLRRKIEGFLNSKYGVYYKAFHRLFSSKMTNEFTGLRASLSNWVSGSATLTQKGMKQASKVAKALSPIPGASLAVNVLMMLPIKASREIRSNMLKSLAKIYPNNEDVDCFIAATSFSFMELFEKQLILFDKYDKSHGYQVDEEAMSLLVSSLTSRLFAFMFSSHFQKGENLFPSGKKEMERRAKTLALSVTWFNPNLFFKLEYYEKLPFINGVILSLPTQKSLTLFQKTAQGRRAIGKLFVGNTKGFKGSQKALTDKGLCQRSPCLIQGEYFGPRDCRPKDYPSLSLSQEEQGYIESQTKRKKGFFRPIAVPRRLTLSYRELDERLHATKSSDTTTSSNTSQGTIFVGPRLNQLRGENRKRAEVEKVAIEDKISLLQKYPKKITPYGKELLLVDIKKLKGWGIPDSEIEKLTEQVQALNPVES